MSLAGVQVKRYGDLSQSAINHHKEEESDARPRSSRLNDPQEAIIILVVSRDDQMLSSPVLLGFFYASIDFIHKIFGSASRVDPL